MEMNRRDFLKRASHIAVIAGTTFPWRSAHASPADGAACHNRREPVVPYLLRGGPNPPPNADRTPATHSTEVHMENSAQCGLISV